MLDAAHGIVFPAIGDNLPHLPTQLFMKRALSCCWRYSSSGSSPGAPYTGQVFWIYVAAYATVGRFIIEIYRGDVERGTLLSRALSPPLWSRSLRMALAIAFHFVLRKKKP